MCRLSVNTGREVAIRISEYVLGCVGSKENAGLEFLILILPMKME